MQRDHQFYDYKDVYCEQADKARRKTVYSFAYDEQDRFYAAEVEVFGPLGDEYETDILVVLCDDDGDEFAEKPIDPMALPVDVRVALTCRAIDAFTDKRFQEINERHALPLFQK